MITLFNQQVQKKKKKNIFSQFFFTVFPSFISPHFLINFMEWCKEFGLLYSLCLIFHLYSNIHSSTQSKEGKTERNKR